MVHRRNFRWPIAVGIGLTAGLILGGFWPSTPLHAVSTDRVDTFAMATGPVDAEVEAVYLLDFLTGDLVAVVLGRQPNTWAGYFRANVAEDLHLDPQKNPKFMMVTGVVGLRRAGGTRQMPSSAACYVAEVTTGGLVAYAIPWSPNMYVANQMQQGRLQPWAACPFKRPTAGMGPGGAPVIGPAKGRDKEKEKE